MIDKKILINHDPKWELNKAVLKNIILMYSGEELEYQLLAWEQFPTLKTDCLQKSLEKAALRSKFVKNLKSNKVN